MAADSGTDLAGYRAQLKTTHLFWTPADTLTFITSPDLAKTMQRVAQFFDKGLLGGAQSADFIGMTFPGGVTVGDTANSKLRFDDSYLKLAAAGSCND
jgi:NitT/TauT family transport system substrate-binding protein